MQGVRRAEAVDLDLFRRGEIGAPLDHIEVTGGAGAVPSALMLQSDPVLQRRVQYRIAWRGGDGKAVRQKR